MGGQQASKKGRTSAPGRAAKTGDKKRRASRSARRNELLTPSVAKLALTTYRMSAREASFTIACHAPARLTLKTDPRSAAFTVVDPEGVVAVEAGTHVEIRVRFRAGDDVVERGGLAIVANTGPGEREAVLNIPLVGRVESRESERSERKPEERNHRLGALSETEEVEHATLLLRRAAELISNAYQHAMDMGRDGRSDEEMSALMVRAASALHTALEAPLPVGNVPPTLLSAIDAAFLQARRLAHLVTRSSGTKAIEDALDLLKRRFSVKGWRQPRRGKGLARYRKATKGANAAPPSISLVEAETAVSQSLRAATAIATSLGTSRESVGERLAAQAGTIGYYIETATQIMRERLTKGEQWQVHDRVKRLSQALDALAQRANHERAGTGHLEKVFAAEAKLRLVLNKEPKARIVEGSENLSATGVLDDLTKSNKGAKVPTPLTKAAAISNIRRDLPSVFDRAGNGLKAAERAIGETEPPPNPGVVESLLMIAASVALAGAAGVIGTLAKELLKGSIRGVSDAELDGFKDGVKALIKDSVKTATRSRRPSTRKTESSPEATISGRTLQSKFLARQESALLDAKIQSGARLESLLGSLQALPLEALSEVSRRVLLLASSDAIANAQELATITEWVNFKARAQLGAREGESMRDADLSSKNVPDVSRTAAVLHVHADLALAGPRLKRVALPGVEPSILAAFKDKTQHTVRSVPFNKIFHATYVHLRSRGGVDSARIEVVWKPDSRSLELRPLSALAKEVLIAYGLGHTRRPPDPDENLVLNRVRLVSLYTRHGEAGVVRGAQKLLDALGNTSLRGLES